MNTELQIAEIVVKRGNRLVGGMDKDGLKELAESIKAVGVLEPIIVRPTGGKPPYELVVGERRLLACKILKRTTIPATIQELDDQQVTEVRVIENLQRQDIHPLDEAAGYRELLMAGVGDVAEIAARVGRSMSYVYGRLKLFDLTPEAKEFVNSGAISAGAAVKLARLPEKAQTKIIKTHALGANGTTDAKTMEYWTKWGGVMHPLADVPFDVKDDNLLPMVGACAVCPKRTGTDPTLFEDNPDDMCMDGVCLKKKYNAWAAGLAGGREFDIRIQGEGGQGVGTIRPTAKQGWDYEKCKKSEEGALRALVVTGKEIGKMRWVKKRPRETYSYNDAEWQEKQKERIIAVGANRFLRERFCEAVVSETGDVPTRLVATIFFKLERCSAFLHQLENQGVIPVGDEVGIAEAYELLAVADQTKILRAIAYAGISAVVEASEYNESSALVVEKIAEAFHVDLVSMLSAARELAEDEYATEHEEKKVGVCRVCGCTDSTPCVDPATGETCSWVEPDLCSACATKMVVDVTEEVDYEVVDD